MHLLQPCHALLLEFFIAHSQYLIDKQGYIRARWLPTENDAWQKIDLLLKQVELLRNEKPRAPAPDDHVH